MRKFAYKNGEIDFRKIFLEKKIKFKSKLSKLKNQWNALRVSYYHKKFDLIQKIYNWQSQKIHIKLIKYRKIIKREDITIKMSKLIL